MVVKRKNNEELLTLSEVSRMLKVHPNTLRSWDEKGILRAVRFGIRGDRRYKKSEVEKLLNKYEKSKF